jgi:hypothetical protein
MSSEALITKYEQLPPEIQKVVDIFVDALVKKEVPKVAKGKAKFGSAKVKMWMADDFDAPLDAFKEYMA